MVAGDSRARGLAGGEGSVGVGVSVPGVGRGGCV